MAHDPPADDRPVALRPCTSADGPWLLGVGLDPEKAGSQYTWAEAPLQLLIAPWRALQAPRRRSAIVEVGGRRAGYIGPNPLSRNLEYFLQPWARGGRGATVVAAYFRLFPTRDRDERFFVSTRNARSLAALRSGLSRLGWVEGDEYRVDDTRGGRRVTVARGARPAGR